jgi:hypothetical protein
MLAHRALLPDHSYRVQSSSRTTAGKNLKWTLTKAEGGSVLAGVLPSIGATEAAFGNNGKEVFTNVEDFIKPTPPVLYTNRPWITVNRPADPLERSHANQIPGAVLPSQLVPLVVQACRRRDIRRAKLTRQTMLGHMRFIGRVEESSSIANKSPIATLRVGPAMCNFHLELADETGADATAEQLGLTVGMPMYVTLPPVDGSGKLKSDEFRLTPFDPAPRLFGSSAVDMSELSRAVLHHAKTAMDQAKLDRDGNLDVTTARQAMLVAAAFGDNVHESPPTGRITGLPTVATLTELYDVVIASIIGCVREMGDSKTANVDNDRPHLFDKKAGMAGPADQQEMTGEALFLYLSNILAQSPTRANELIATELPNVFETNNFDNFLGIHSRVPEDEKPMLRQTRFVGHLFAGVFPPFRAIRAITQFSADAVLREITCKRADHGSGGRSDCYVGRLGKVEPDNSVTIFMQ